MAEGDIPVLASAGGKGPEPYEQAPPRVVFVPYQSIATNQGTDIRYDFNQLGSASGQLMPGDLRELDKVRFSSRQGEFSGTQKFEYTGGLLVDEKNRLARTQYDVNGEPLGLLRSLGSNAERSSLLNLLYQKGFYTSGKPSSNGYSNQDQNAIGGLLEYSNSMGRTWQVARLEIQSLENERNLGGAASVRVTSREDIRKYVTSDSLAMLGRVPTRQEFQEMLQFIQNRERSVVSGSQQASLSSLSSMAVQQVAPREVQVNDAADGIDIFREMLRTARG